MFLVTVRVVTVAEASVLEETKRSPVVTPEVREILRVEAFAALKSLPRRGAEMGGFLTASVEGEDRQLCADGIELVKSEHLYGPYYRLSPADLELFRQKVQESRKCGASRPVAYFRSCTRDKFAVEADDFLAVRDVLPGVGFVLLIKPDAAGNATVKVFEAETFEPVEEFDLRMSFYVPREDEPEAEPAKHEHAAVSLETLATERRPVQRRYTASWLWYLATAALVVLAVAGVIRYRQLAAPLPIRAAELTSHDLGMRVEKEANQFRVTWNRSVAALGNYTGSMTISDGAKSRELALDQNQIASGSLIYVSEAKDLNFRMQVNGDQGKRLAESVRVVVAQSEPPIGKTEKGPGAEQLMVAQVRAWPLNGSRTSTFYPALPVHRIRPEVRSSLINKPSVVTIEVKVNDKGRVTAAHAVDATPALPADIPARAIDASKQWTFEPAKSHGRNVLSDYTIVYSFTPAGW